MTLAIFYCPPSLPVGCRRTVRWIRNFFYIVGAQCIPISEGVQYNVQHEDFRLSESFSEDILGQEFERVRKTYHVTSYNGL